MREVSKIQVRVICGMFLLGPKFCYPGSIDKSYLPKKELLINFMKEIEDLGYLLKASGNCRLLRQLQAFSCSKSSASGWQGICACGTCYRSLCKFLSFKAIASNIVH